MTTDVHNVRHVPDVCPGPFFVRKWMIDDQGRLLLTTTGGFYQSLMNLD